MKNMTYQELLDYLQSLSEEQKQMDVTVYSQEFDEYHGVLGVFTNEEDDVLDAQHPYLAF